MSDLRIHHRVFSDDTMAVVFSDERSMTIPLQYFLRLRSAAPASRDRWSLIGRGLGVHWEELDEDLSVENILSTYSPSKAAEYAPASPS